MRRAAISIPSNIAEGYRRRSTKEYLHFLNVSNGLGAELETQVEICKRVPKLQEFDYKRAFCERNTRIKLRFILVFPSRGAYIDSCALGTGIYIARLILYLMK